jgi:hypothetical protein
MWSLGTAKLFVQDNAFGQNQSIARLQPLDTGTVYHRFGYESEIRKVQALVVGDTNVSLLTAMTLSGSYPLIRSDLTDLGDFLVKSVNAKQNETIWQTFDSGQDCDAPVYVVDIELYAENTLVSP